MTSNASQLTHLLRTRLKMKQLAVLATIAQEGSLHRAAAAQGLSQPALSKMVKEIEDAIGAPLFERSPAGLQPTRFGERLIFRARALLADLDQLALELAAIKEGYGSSLRVGMIPLLSSTLLANAIERLEAEKKHYVFQISVGSTDLLIGALRAHTLDCVLARFPGATFADDLDCRALYAQRSCLVTHAEGLLKGRREPIALSGLTDCAWILPPHPTPTRKAIDRMFLLADITPPVPAFECFDPAVIGALLASRRDLVAILPQEIAEDLSADGQLMFFPVEAQFALPEICLIKLRGAREDPALAHFSAALAQAIRARAP
ncbi:MAG TPA: LysR family transcriptional regulator [Pseudolabrys sp.]|nr:LysR family transcriptional regulator [Pseudolabrys sp.]